MITLNAERLSRACRHHTPTSRSRRHTCFPLALRHASSCSSWSKGSSAVELHIRCVGMSALAYHRNRRRPASSSSRRGACNRGRPASSSSRRVACGNRIIWTCLILPPSTVSWHHSNGLLLGTKASKSLGPNMFNPMARDVSASDTLKK